MSTTKNLFQRLLAVADEIGAIAKGGRTSYGDKYAYHKIDDVEEHLRPALIKHGVVALVSVAAHEMAEAGKTRNDAQQWQAEVELEVTFVNADEPSERETVRAWGQGIDTGDKGAGKAISYALKNVYLATFHMRGQVDVEDDDSARRSARPAAAAKGKATPPKAEPAGPAPDSRQGRMAAASKAGKWPLNRESWAEQMEQCRMEYGTTLDNLDDEQFAELVLWIESGGTWPDGYKPLKLREGIADDVAEVFGEEEVA